ncbi:MAG: acetyl-CoA carboxylase biotin carboxyl carrier protein [Pyrinomonadaceae bacterium]
MSAAFATGKKMSDQGSQKAEIELQAETEVEASSEPGRSRRRRRGSVGAESSVNMDELRELIQLINENDFTEFELEREGFRVRFRRGAEISEASTGAFSPSRELAESTTVAVAGHSASTTSAPSHPGAKAQTEASEDQGLYIIPSPIVGTFYRSASPNSEAFVKIGSWVEPDSVVCIIEAMKLMNEIQAESSGEVAKIYVENGQPVEYGQPLFGIKK